MRSCLGLIGVILGTIAALVLMFAFIGFIGAYFSPDEPDAPNISADITNAVGIDDDLATTVVGCLLLLILFCGFWFITSCTKKFGGVGKSDSVATGIFEFWDDN